MKQFAQWEGIMQIRTDLAVETFPDSGISDSVHISRRGKAFGITDIVIDDDSCLDTLGKGKGRYITLESDRLSRYTDDYEEMAQELAAEIGSFIPEGDILVAGLGNNDITPDALGPQAAAKVLATRHLRDELDNDEEQFLTSLRRVSSFEPSRHDHTDLRFGNISRQRSCKYPPRTVSACAGSSRDSRRSPDSR